ncbi:YhbY family RNA-binding protein [Candidatus Woesearchaeota archaeon]|nr:YhbY family RNA-binding protein [Candidatus Woesearchaeota archaeon]
MDATKKKELKNQARTHSPVIAIGKQGVTKTVIEQIKKYLQAHKLCKIKFSKDITDEMSLSKKAFASYIATQTGAELIDQIGFIIVLWKR